MSEEHSPPAPEVVTTAVPTAAPVPETVVEPAVPAPAEGGALPAEAPAEPSAEPALKPHTDEPGLLQTTPPEEAPKTQTPDGEKPLEAIGETAPPQSEPIAYEFALPEGFTVPDGRIDELTGLMREGNVPRETADKLWGMHTAAMQEMVQHLEQQQHDVFLRMRTDQKNRIAADPEFGGAGMQTSIARANRMIDLMLTGIKDPAQKEAERKEINDWLRYSGSEDSHPFFRGLNRIAALLDEPQGGPPPNPRPPTPAAQAGRAPGRGRGLYTFTRGGGSRS